ncbi:MAG TPA: GNAT family protein [Caulobacteraceae bacterium]
MRLDESGLIISYFHQSTPEHLELLGVDPTRLPTQEAWQNEYQIDFARPIDQRRVLQLSWLSNDQPIGFSTCNKIVYGDHASMHLHILEPGRRQLGAGAECVRQSIEIYFDRLKLRTLLCEPNAFNVSPNRTLQKAGFKYAKTHMTVPGPINFHQAVTRWVIER